MYILLVTFRLGEALAREDAPGPQVRLLDAVRARQARARDEGAHCAHALGDGLAERELVEATRRRVGRRVRRGVAGASCIIARHAAAALLGVAAAALYLGDVDAGPTPRKHAAG